MKKNILIIFTVVFALYFWLSSIKDNHRRKVVMSDYKVQLNYQKNLKNLIQDNVIHQLYSNNTALSPQVELNDIEGNTINLLDLLADKNKLVFRFSDQSCMDCVHQELKHLDEIVTQIGIESVLILVDTKNDRLLRILSEKVQFKNQFFSLKDPIQIQIESLGIPYLFTIDKSLIIKNLFIPSIELPMLSLGYYKFIEKEIINDVDKGDLHSLGLL